MLNLILWVAIVSVACVIPVYLFDKFDAWYNRDVEDYRG